MTVEEKLYGCQSMTGRLRRVLVRAPRAEDLRGWQACGWRAEPDAAAIAREHDAFCSLLDQAGAEVVLAESGADGNPDAIYTYDPALVADEGALLLHPGKEMRRAEVDAWPRTSSAPAFRSRAGCTTRPGPRAATAAGSTSTPCSSGAATARTRPGSPACGSCCPASRSSRSTCRTGTDATR